MRFTRLACQNTHVGTGHLYVEPRLGNHHANLIEHAGGSEAGERAGHRDETQRGQTGRHTNHVLLRDADLEEPFRHRLPEIIHFRRRSEVGVENDDILVHLTDLRQRFSEGMTH